MLLPYFTDEEQEGVEVDDDIIEDELENDEGVEEDEEAIAPYREYELDPTGRFTGRIVEGTDAIVSWVILTLYSDRYNHEVYSWNYGNEFGDMVGSSYSPDLLQSECRRMTEEALLVNEHITAIRNFSAVQVNDLLDISFTLVTDQGDEADVEVSLDGIF